MTENRRFCRVLLEMEFEVTDETALAAHLFDWTSDEEGQPMMMDQDPDLPDMPGTSQQYRIGRAAIDAMHTGLRAGDYGIKWMGSSTLVRAITAEGTYQSFHLPELPARRDDGNLPD